MKKKCRLRITRDDFDIVNAHLFPGDRDEHGAVLLAGVSQTDGQLTLHVREVHLAAEDIDYVEGKFGYRALAPQFIHRLITRARDERLAYLAVHNHGSDREVGFSSIDFDSHERGYPALLQIARGMPVGALVFGRRSIQADIWLPDGTRSDLDFAVVVGNTVQRLTPSPEREYFDTEETYERQIRIFGKAGQQALARCRVGIIGLGGIGSIVAELLARLGVGHFCLVDNDLVEESNLSRIVGASASDARQGIPKVAIAQRVILNCNSRVKIHIVKDDVAKESTAKAITSCDYLFLAADSMRARLVFNAIVHQYLIPGVQLGSKVHCDDTGALVDVMSANRPVRPKYGCLWCNQLIDQNQLAKEAKTDEERKAQAYGVNEPNPSVISLNAISASHAVNDFLMDYLGLRPDNGKLYYEHFHFLSSKRSLVEPRRDAECSECSPTGLRYGRGDSIALPCIEG
ncbi:MAG: ThiF family adenylyltransferase [Nitrospiraceae bacterium]|nr:ThiF family adenylyltransferase [Nitrospiraceae bacterium]